MIPTGIDTSFSMAFAANRSMCQTRNAMGFKDWGVHVIYTDAIDTLFKHRFQENLYYKAEVVDDPDVNKAF